jgi:NifU-like protein involved in Fe-S cluster formation
MVSPFDPALTRTRAGMCHRVAAACAIRVPLDGTDAAFVRFQATMPAPKQQAPFSSLPSDTYIVALTRPAINGFPGYAAVMRTPSMLNDVYNRKILELAGSIPRIGKLDQPDASATAHSKLCGSTVSIDLKMDGDTVSDFAHEVKACALGQASSSIMARNVVGAKADELRALRDNVRKMLKENGAPPADGRWADIAVLEPVRDYKARHASTLLTFDAVVDAINQIEAKRLKAAE